jgi:hypothetical protein
MGKESVTEKDIKGLGTVAHICIGEAEIRKITV